MHSTNNFDSFSSLADANFVQQTSTFSPHPLLFCILLSVNGLHTLMHSEKMFDTEVCSLEKPVMPVPPNSLSTSVFREVVLKF